MKEPCVGVNQWIDLPSGFASLSEAKNWAKSVEQAQNRIELLKLIELIFRVEELFSRFSEIKQIDFSMSRSTGSHELTLWIEKDQKLQELSTYVLAITRSNPISAIGPLPGWAELEKMENLAKEANDLIKNSPNLRYQAPALWPYEEISVQRPQTSWRAICNALKASNAILAIERSQIEKETQSGSKGGSRSSL